MRGRRGGGERQGGKTCKPTWHSVAPPLSRITHAHTCGVRATRARCGYVSREVPACVVCLLRLAGLQPMRRPLLLAMLALLASPWLAAPAHGEGLLLPLRWSRTRGRAGVAPAAQESSSARRRRLAASQGASGTLSTQMQLEANAWGQGCVRNGDVGVTTLLVVLPSTLPCVCLRPDTPPSPQGVHHRRGAGHAGAVV